VTGAPIGAVLGQQPAAGTHHRAGTITVDVSVGNRLVAVPSLAGLTLAAAQAKLAAADLVAGQPLAKFSSTVPSGTIIDWSPKTQAAVATPAFPINLVVSKGAQFVTMPDVVSTPEAAAQAVSAIEAVGFDASQITQTQAYSTTVPVGDVISTDPAAGAQADRAATVSMVVSKGPQTVKVPDVRGESVTAATAALTADGLTVGGVFGPGTTDVIDETPSAGTTVKVGSPVDLFCI
jgi:eukaryotic-like serine/threonine-protein kinase